MAAAPKKSKTAADNAVFDLLKTELERLAPPFSPRTGTVKGKRDYVLYSAKAVEIDGKKYPEMYFAAAIEQKGYTGFYFMPLYAAPEVRERISPALLKLLKGKSCFHLKSADGETLVMVREALQAGHEVYRKRGWV